MSQSFSFVHTADLHLGSLQYGLDERRDDFSKAFTWVVDSALELKVDFVIIAGDLFDNPRPSTATLTEAIAQLKRLRDSEIPVLAVNGSHDTSQTPETSILTPLDKAELLRFLPLYGSDGWSDDRCYVYGLFNYSSRLRLAKELPAYLRGHPPKPTKGFNICVLHQALESPGVAAPFAAEIREEQLPKGFQYYASGHLHKHLVLRLDTDSYFVYPGATETKDVREAPEKKGFCYVQVQSPEEVEIEHRDIPTRRFLSATVDCNDLTPNEIDGEAIKKIRQIDSPESVIALTLSGSLPSGYKRYQIDYNAILSARRKAIHVQILNHLTETQPTPEERHEYTEARDLRERILPYLKAFLGEEKTHNRPRSSQKELLADRVDMFWNVINDAKTERLSSSLTHSLSDRLTELADDAASNC